MTPGGRTYTATLLGAGQCPRMGTLEDLSTVIATDFTALGKALTARGFRVQSSETSASKADFDLARDEAQQIGAHTTHLVVLSCHGAEENQGQILYPTDARPRIRFPFIPDEWRPAQPTALVVVVIDACRTTGGPPSLTIRPRHAGEGQVLVVFGSRLYDLAQAVVGYGSLLSQALVRVLAQNPEALGLTAFGQSVQARGKELHQEWLKQCPGLASPEFRVFRACETAAAVDDGHLLVCPGPIDPQAPAVLATVDPQSYLTALEQETGFIDIRGLEVGSGKAQRLRIEDLYIPLSTSTQVDEKSENQTTDEAKQPSPPHRSHRITLDEALKKSRALAIIGDPGAGKSTFLKRIAWRLSRTWQSGSTGPWEGLFPILIAVEGLLRHQRNPVFSGCQPAPVDLDAPLWLAHYAACQAHEREQNLNQDFFQDCMKRGKAAVLIDGLDEAPSDRAREAMAKLVERARVAYPKCHFAVTSRPVGRDALMVLPGFHTVEIDALGEEEISGFLRHWSKALFQGNVLKCDEHVAALTEALNRPAIKKLARNPVMLTALAVVHWHEKRLPEQRAELYASILKWLSEARQKREGRPQPQQCLSYLAKLALWMQDHPDGRQVQVSEHAAAQALAPEIGMDRDQAQAFLAQEQLDSGIVVRRGKELRFWHLSFQEYLAARALAGDDDRRDSILADPKKRHAPAWREVILLLAGELASQGEKRAQKMLFDILVDVKPKSQLVTVARSVGLVGAALADLVPTRFQFDDPRYREGLHRVQSLFTREGSASVPIKDAIAAADALGVAGDPRFQGAALRDKWVSIPAGTFWMGAQKKNPQGRNFDAEADKGFPEAPVHAVTLSAYRLGRYPVTVQEYRDFVENDGYTDERWWSAGGFGQVQAPEDWENQLAYPTRPVVGVNWFEANAYASWFCQQIPGSRLPTEAEWERAARGLEGRRYPWGNEEAGDRHLNCAGKIGHPTPVGLYPLGHSPEGLTDLAGNVWEWCQDWFGDYSPENQTDPTGPPNGGVRVVRGGSWDFPARYCRSANRFGGRPEDRGWNLGFRLSAGLG